MKYTDPACWAVSYPKGRLERADEGQTHSFRSALATRQCHPAVIAWGEFGRTPKINKDAGRDHWPRVSCALMAGGGLKTGQVIGSTDRLGGEPDSRPVTFEEIHATLYHNLGINLATSPRLFDFRGRPQYLVDPGVRPIKELV